MGLEKLRAFTLNTQLSDIANQLANGMGTYSGIISSQVYTATAGQTAFTLTNTNGKLFMVLVNNVPQTAGIGYTRTSDILATLSSGATIGDTVVIYYTVTSSVGSGHVIQDEGTSVTARTNLNFVGAGVAVTDDLVNDRTVVTIPSGGGSSVPVATFTQSGNTEIVISSIDVATGTFTSVGHGLVNNQQVAPLLNLNAGKVFLPNVVPTGLTMGVRYVVNATTDTFQLSATSGGSALTYTTNANQDLTKWHFEKSPGAFTPLVLTASKKYKLHIKGRSLTQDNAPYLQINSIASSNEWLTSTFGYQTFYIGNVYVDLWFDIDFSGLLSIWQRGITIKTTNTTTNAQSMTNIESVNVSYSNTDITSISFSYPGFANGTLVEVYAV